jgi:hypothetical protein
LFAFAKLFQLHTFAFSAVDTAQGLLFDTSYSDILRVGFGGDITQVFALLQVSLVKDGNHKGAES